MDFENIVTSLIGSGLASLGVGWILKIVLEKALDAKIAVLKAEQEASLTERVRREAFVWDRQYDVSKTLLSLMYRLRNALRDMVVLLQAESSPGGEDELSRRIDAYSFALRELLFEERAVMPPDLFPLAHELSKEVHLVNAITRELGRHLTGQGKGVPRQGKLTKDIEAVASRIDSIFSAATEIIQSRIGVASSDSTSNQSGPPDANRAVRGRRR